MEARLHELGVEVEEGTTDTDVHRLLIRTLSDRLNDSIESAAPEVVEDATPVVALPPKTPRPLIPNAAIWAHLANMAGPLSRSNLVKPALRGKENDVLMVLLTGWDLQITMTQALAKIHIIEGQPSASPELILGLIRREGHLAWPGGPDNCGIEQEDASDIRTLCGIVHAVRKDDPERIITMRFSVADAERAGLVVIKNGQPVALSTQNKPLPWQTYTEDLLWARAVSRMGRRNFSDVLLGLTYVPEELGFIDVPSVEVGQDPNYDPEMMPSKLAGLKERVMALNLTRRSELALAWKDLIDTRKLHALDLLRESEYEDADALIKAYERLAADDPPDPPCEADAAETEDKAVPAEGDAASGAEGLPFACEDPEQPSGQAVCPSAHQCRAAEVCLLAPF